MRKIKFRGISLETDDWVYGYLADGNLICTWDNLRNAHEVLSTTVGQFTGLVDKNGKEIYEGDIVAEGVFKRVISFIPEAAAFCSCSPYESSIRTRTSADEMRYYEVVGNIHDNPELMKGGQK